MSAHKVTFYFITKIFPTRTPATIILITKEHITGDGFLTSQLLIFLLHFLAFNLLLPEYILTGDTLLIAQLLQALLSLPFCLCLSVLWSVTSGLTTKTDLLAEGESLLLLIVLIWWE